MLSPVTREPWNGEKTIKKKAYRLHETVFVEIAVQSLVLGHRALLGERPAEALVAHGGVAQAQRGRGGVATDLRVLVGAVEDGAEEPALDGGLVQDQRILLVVARVAADRHHAVAAGRQLLEAQVGHGFGGHQRLLGVGEHVRGGVHALSVVADVHAHGLLAHGGLVGVSRRLVVVGEGNDRGAHAQDHGGMDLAVRVGRAAAVLHAGAHGLQIHADHAVLLLLRRDVLDQAVQHQVREHRFRLQVPQMVLTNLHALRYRVHDIQGTAATARVGGDSKLSLLDVVHHRHIGVEVLAVVQNHLGVAMDPHPHAVHEHLGGLGDQRRRDRLQLLHAVVLQQTVDLLHLSVTRPRRSYRIADRDVAHQREVLHDTAGLALGRLGGTHHAPLRAVQQTRLGHLARGIDGGLQSTQVRQRRRVGQAVQGLRDARRGGHAARAISPIARRERILETVRNDAGLDARRRCRVRTLALVMMLMKEPPFRLLTTFFMWLRSS